MVRRSSCRPLPDHSGLILADIVSLFFKKEYPIDDLIVINYPFMINNKTYVNWLNRLVGKGT